MMHEILLRFGLTEPNIDDVIDKIIKNHLNNQEISDLKTIGYIYRFFNLKNLYAIKVGYDKWDQKLFIKFKTREDAILCKPSYCELNSNIDHVIETLDEMKKHLLYDELSRRNASNNYYNEYLKKEICCRNKLWKRLNE